MILVSDGAVMSKTITKVLLLLTEKDEILIKYLGKWKSSRLSDTDIW